MKLGVEFTGGTVVTCPRRKRTVLKEEDFRISRGRHKEHREQVSDTVRAHEPATITMPWQSWPTAKYDMSGDQIHGARL